MSQAVRIRPANSLIFISDRDGGEAPIPVRGAMVWSTPSCVAVVCYPEQDGPTELILGAAGEVNPGDPPLFDGHLDLPNRTVIVSTVELKAVLEENVQSPTTRLRVWTNHAQWPDKVIIGVG